ncbi:hypothetical protein SISNIDRAFT_470397 [Sistotremastrum niveocremeum HHB9708]|uniref:Uncharacterized protein n=2 Tax=Sistotremastraceae TaxID=3402574 RepID=A0A164NV26_9AGAM|nr:hypothetical protein SISNIDRAFT_470397 [Sistotremastrum niveocremeum HHB9708]KZT40506.1 hypothetical protein SISSUDRAFT_1031917 [Sistotremastrum suecicum HHB10207 ss-3]
MAYSSLFNEGLRNAYPEEKAALRLPVRLENERQVTPHQHVGGHRRASSHNQTTRARPSIDDLPVPRSSRESRREYEQLRSRQYVLDGVPFTFPLPPPIPAQSIRPRHDADKLRSLRQSSASDRRSAKSAPGSRTQSPSRSSWTAQTWKKLTSKTSSHPTLDTASWTGTIDNMFDSPTDEKITFALPSDASSTRSADEIKPRFSRPVNTTFSSNTSTLSVTTSIKPADSLASAEELPDRGSIPPQRTHTANLTSPISSFLSISNTSPLSAHAPKSTDKSSRRCTLSYLPSHTDEKSYFPIELDEKKRRLAISLGWDLFLDSSNSVESDDSDVVDIQVPLTSEAASFPSYRPSFTSLDSPSPPRASPPPMSAKSAPSKGRRFSSFLPFVRRT